MTVGSFKSSAALSCSVFVTTTVGEPSPPPVVPLGPQLLVAAHPINSEGGGVPDDELLDEELLEEELLDDELLDEELLDEELLEDELLDEDDSPEAPEGPPQATKVNSASTATTGMPAFFMVKSFIGSGLLM